MKDGRKSDVLRLFTKEYFNVGMGHGMLNGLPSPLLLPADGSDRTMLCRHGKDFNIGRCL